MVQRKTGLINGDSPAQIFLTGYETLREDFTANPQSPPRRRVWDLVVLDEAQKIKNKKTEISRKCKLLLRRKSLGANRHSSGKQG